ncbi:MAG: cell wall-binding repeat-containing protein, partial [Chloroflexota bacterium]|nr:cell wall-binding repeat-containing protein [Chloroflexota bacterium]
MNRITVRRPLAILAALTLLASLAAPVAAVDGATYVQLTNEKRASVGKGPVALHSAVDKVTVERANHMAATDEFEHDMAYVASRLTALGVCYTGYGEIIAYTTRNDYDPSNAIERWWASTGHHAIMVGDYTHAGGSHTRSTATNRMYSVMVFVKLCSGSTSPAPPSGSDAEISRIAGSDRYATAAAISKSRFSGGATTVFVATGASFPDALAGAPAAARAKAPVLLTARNELPAATATELARLDPSVIVVLGGSGVVSDGVISKLRGYAGTVVRWAGADRFATAARISANSFSSGVKVAYLATADTFPDALSGGAVAGRVGGPILLVNRNGIPGATAKELARLKPAKIVILGGTSVVSDAVRSAADAYTSGSVSRLAGADRYATSVQVSRSAYSSSDSVFIATGTKFPDGLAGGPVAALLPGPLLLVAPTQLPSVVK